MSTPYEFDPGVMLRVPLYSFSAYDPALLKELVGTPVFQNALFLASPAFFRIIEKKAFDWSCLSEKERYGLLRYYNRMSFRATPFGAFASVSLLRWRPGDQPAALSADQDSCLHLLPGQELLTSLLENLPPPGGPEPLMLNPTLYRTGDQFRYIKSHRKEGSLKYEFVLTAIAAEPLTGLIIERLHSGAAATAEVLAIITGAAGADVAEATDYLHFLLEEQCLFSCRQGSVLQDQAPAPLVSAMSAMDIPSELRSWPSRQTLPLGETPSLAALAGRLLSAPHREGLEERALFYAGLERRVISGGAPQADQPELLRGLEALQRLALPVPADALQHFITAFRARFEQQQVPLLLALDPDRGIGYGEVQGITGGDWLQDIPYAAPAETKPGIPWTAVQQLFMQKWLMNRHHAPGAPLEISPADLHALPLPSPGLALPPGLAVLYSHTSEGLMIEHAGGASATFLPGRFSVFSREVEVFCRRLADGESRENPGVLFADISQVTDQHVDNINRRSNIFDWGLPVNTWMTGAPEGDIALQDLALKLHGHELVLLSLSRGRRVIPRLSTAYNALHNGLGIFRLLYDLQYQGLRHQLTLDLESLFPGLEHYPRVVTGGIILAPAKWVFQQAAITALCRRPFSLGRLHLFRQAHHLPPRITMGLGDQQLSFELSDDGQALFFLDCISRLPKMILQEYLLPLGKGVQVDGRPHQGQFMAALIKKGITYDPLVPEPTLPGDVQREFPMGSDWLYLKLFCTPSSAGVLLRDIVAPLVADHREQISNWFFVRYNDPAPHLRLRLQLTGPFTGKLLAALRERMNGSAHEQLLRDYQGDTYRRELERYGAARFGLIEAAFTASSELVTAWITRADPAIQETGLPGFALQTVDMMARTMLPHEPSRKDFLERRAAALRGEYADPAATKRLQDERYRDMAPQIRTWLDGEPVERFPAALQPALAAFRQVTARVAEGIVAQDAASRHALLADLIHMHVNRLFAADQRRHEALICHLLQKYYSYRIAVGH